MRQRIDERPGVGQQPPRYAMAPELFRLFELLKYFDGLGDIDRSISATVWGITQFTDPGMAGASIVPSVGAFVRQFAVRFVKMDAQARPKLLQQSTQVGAHDAAADQHNVGTVSEGKSGHDIVGVGRTTV